jgi:hypothetical protein
VVISSGFQISYGTTENYHKYSSKFSKILPSKIFFAGTSMVIFSRSIGNLETARNYHNETDDFFVKMTMMKRKKSY